VQNAAKPVWRWNVVGDEVEVDVDVRSDGARFSAGAAVAVVEPDISLPRGSRMILTASRSS
jgi:hypothetical protein